MAFKKKLEKIPGFSQGIRENAAARMVKMAQPICPNSKLEMETTPEGRIIPKRTSDPNRQNCQKLGVGWWIHCEEAGHDPYFSTRVWYSKEDKFETDEATGEQVKTGERTVRHATKYPNISQVAAHVRVNSGRGVEFKMRRHGFKRLKDIGYEEVCQFRNCQKPVTVRSNVGLYCGKQHAALIGADAQSMFLVQLTGRFEAGSEMEIQQKRNRGLIEAASALDITEIK